MMWYLQLKKIFITFFISNKGAIICFTIALISKLLLTWVCIKNGPDRMFFLVAAKNFNSGIGLTIERSYLEDVSIKNKDFVTSSPPLYPLVLSVFLKAFPDNPILACYIIDALASFLFLFYLFRLCSLLGFSPILRNIFILFQGFFIHEFIFTSSPTDFLALSFLVAGWYYSYLFDEKKRLPINFAIAAVFFLLAAFTRYQYMPVPFIYTFFLFYSSKKENSQQLKNFTFFNLIFITICITILYLYQNNVSNNSYYPVESKSGWFPENLLLAYPFGILSLLNMDFMSSQLAALTKVSYFSWSYLFYYLSFALLPFLFYKYYKWYIKYKNARPFNFYYWVSGALISSGIVLFLIFLSVTRNSKLLLIEWTYVADARYFCFPALFIQISIWRWIFIEGRVHVFKKIVASLISFIYLIGAIHGLYFISNRIMNNSVSLKDRFLFNKVSKLVHKHVTDAKNNYKDKKIGFFCIIKEYNYFALWYGANGVFMLDKIVDRKPNATESTVLIAAIPNNMKRNFSLIANYPGARKLDSTSNYIFYQLNVEPSAK